MGSKNRIELDQSYWDPYDDYDEDPDENRDDAFREISKDFFSTEWENPSGKSKKLTTRRIIERRNELRELASQFDDWEEIELGTAW